MKTSTLALMILFTSGVSVVAEEGQSPDAKVTEKVSEKSTEKTVVKVPAGKAPVGKADAKETTQDKDALYKILTGLKLKSGEKDKNKTEVPVAVASAGARAGNLSAASGKRLSPVWPEGNISPLAALSWTIQHGVENGDSWSSQKLILMDFVEDFPEYKDEPLLGELEKLLER